MRVLYIQFLHTAMNTLAFYAKSQCVFDCKGAQRYSVESEPPRISAAYVHNDKS